MRLVLLALLLASPLLSACGGGSSSPAPPANSNGAGPPNSLYLTLGLATPTGVTPTGPSTQNLSISLTAAGAAQPFLASESNYSGAFTVSNNCSGIATLTSNPATPAGPNTAFNVTAVAAGICTITIKDSAGNSASVLLTVTTTSGTIN